MYYVHFFLLFMNPSFSVPWIFLLKFIQFYFIHVPNKKPIEFLWFSRNNLSEIERLPIVEMEISLPISSLYHLKTEYIYLSRVNSFIISKCGRVLEI